MNGRLASTIGPVDFVAGISALASCRSGPGAQLGIAGPEQNARLSELRAGMATCNVTGSSATARWRFALCRANAFAVVLKSVTRFSRFFGCVLKAADTSPPL